MCNIFINSLKFCFIYKFLFYVHVCMHLYIYHIISVNLKKQTMHFERNAMIVLATWGSGQCDLLLFFIIRAYKVQDLRSLILPL